jgi:hypothetical protein
MHKKCFVNANLTSADCDGALFSGRGGIGGINMNPSMYGQIVTMLLILQM